MGFTIDYQAVLRGGYASMFLTGLLVTVQLLVSAWSLAVLLAIVLTAMRTSGVAVLRWMVQAYVEYHRNVPLVVQIMVWYFGVPAALPAALAQTINDSNSEMLFVVIALACNSAAYMSEDLRSGIRSIPATQYEAARSIGLGFFQTLVRVIFPQAIRLAAPPLINQTLILFKNTSLAGVVGVAELTQQSRIIENETFRVFEAFSIVSVAYLIGSFFFMWLGRRLSRRYSFVGR